MLKFGRRQQSFMAMSALFHEEGSEISAVVNLLLFWSPLLHLGITYDYFINFLS